MKVQLKTNDFEVLQVFGNQEQFAELKRFCGNDIKISYETCEIDDYWLIKINDSLKGEWQIVPNFSYIMKLPSGGFTVLNKIELDLYFTYEGHEPEKPEYVQPDYKLQHLLEGLEI